MWWRRRAAATIDEVVDVRRLAPAIRFDDVISRPMPRGAGTQQNSHSLMSARWGTGRGSWSRRAERRPHGPGLASPAVLPGIHVRFRSSIRSISTMSYVVGDEAASRSTACSGLCVSDLPVPVGEQLGQRPELSRLSSTYTGLGAELEHFQRLASNPPDVDAVVWAIIRVTSLQEGLWEANSYGGSVACDRVQVHRRMMLPEDDLHRGQAQPGAGIPSEERVEREPLGFVVHPDAVVTDVHDNLAFVLGRGPIPGRWTFV